ncbi:hypothetical protein HYU17_04800 [Candidatus Woesearchaeota archaeon]|nr:hypothetical protein [Candidatus Woesearchaeota archaeon]
MVDFEEKTIESFRAAKADVSELKRSMNEWIIFLDNSLRDTKEQVRFLERRVSELESEIESIWRR